MKLVFILVNWHKKENNREVGRLQINWLHTPVS
jgi:hypothetical protein